MKKLLLLLACNIGDLFAASDSFSIPLKLRVPYGCAMNFNVPKMQMVLVHGQSSSASTTLSLNCTPGTLISLQVASQNSWSLVGKSHQQSIEYALSYGGSNVLGVNISQIWSGGVADRVVVSGLFNANLANLPLQVTTAQITPEKLNDIYQDQITFNLLF